MRERAGRARWTDRRRQTAPSRHVDVVDLRVGAHKRYLIVAPLNRAHMGPIMTWPT